MGANSWCGAGPACSPRAAGLGTPSGDVPRAGTVLGHPSAPRASHPVGFLQDPRGHRCGGRCCPLGWAKPVRNKSDQLTPAPPTPGHRRGRKEQSPAKVTQFPSPRRWDVTGTILLGPSIGRSFLAGGSRGDRRGTSGTEQARRDPGLWEAGLGEGGARQAGTCPAGEFPEP